MLVRIMFIPSETILHPETREPLIEQGYAITPSFFMAQCKEYGITDCKGQLVESPVTLWREQDNLTYETH